MGEASACANWLTCACDGCRVSARQYGVRMSVGGHDGSRTWARLRCQAHGATYVSTRSAAWLQYLWWYVGAVPARSVKGGLECIACAHASSSKPLVRRTGGPVRRSVPGVVRLRGAACFQGGVHGRAMLSSGTTGS